MAKTKKPIRSVIAPGKRMRLGKLASKTLKAKAASKMKSFPIVGIGASAGGLEAITQLLRQLPIDTGMGFVLLQHLDPKHESMSAEILSHVTQMQVSEVKNGMPVQPNCVYILPSNSSMRIRNGVLNLLPRDEVPGLHLVIDYFFQSLAEDLKNRSVGVVLSGTGSDGTTGLMAIKAEGGITLAQDSQSAKFDGMPKSAVNSGAVDFILSPKCIAEELVRIAHHPYVIPNATEELTVNDGGEALSPEDSLHHIFLLLRNLCHVDFAHYKSNTIGRRIDRRILLRKVKDQNAYAKLLSQDPREVKALFADLLINVTSFFRDPEAFQSLTKKVLPKLLENRASETPIRVWSVGCSTGEETYSIAIALLEFLGDKASSTPIQIFGSDISEQAIQKARLGEYPETIVKDVSRERLNRYFTKMEGGGYKIAKSIRDICIFSRHDVTTDPPFAKIDLITCRNLLIYFTASLQKHVFPIFHYALCANGFLWLGKSETIGGFVNLFSSVDKKNNIYSRKTVPHALNLSFPASTYVPGQQGINRKQTPLSKIVVDVQKMADGALQEQFPGVLINEDMDILQFRGHTNPFIHPAPGLPSHNLLKMANLEILSDLRSAIQRARKTKIAIKKDGLMISEGRSRRTFNLRVIPIDPARIPEPGRSQECYFLIQFEDVAEKKSPQIKTTLDKRKDPRVVELQHELVALQEYQHSLVEKSVAAQENLTTSNEEMQSANEELQSTNEELETAKEELQSGNEELTTVNDELRTRSLEQVQSNNDLTNLLASVQIAIVMLGFDNKIRRFTPLAGKTLNLIASDIGRPFSDMKLNFSMQGVDLNLEEMVSQVAETMEPREVEVQDRRGRWFRLQVRPYKTSDGKIEGAVLALVDIDALILSLKEVEASKADAERANRAKDLFLATLSHELRTPLTAILSWSEMIESGKLDAEKIKRAGTIIRDCGKAQAALIDDLLDVSRIIVGKLTLDLLEVHPEVIILKAIESVLSTAKKKSIQIETYFDPQAGTVMADPQRLQQVFLNLLTNAIKFSSPHSKVIVQLEKAKDQGGEKAKTMIKVIDSGKGISAEFLPHIFDSFSQEDSSSIRVHGGLGLGLAIVRSLVELHGGSIQAESRGEKLGAIFTVLIPRKSDFTSSGHIKRDEEVKIQQNQMNQVRLDGIKVHLVEDEDSTREVFTEMLTSFGAVVTSSASVKEALEVFQKAKPDVLVSDISMPGEDGYSFIRKIRALSLAKGGNVPAVAVTAHAGSEDIERALSAGFQFHVTKPVNSFHLANVIARAVAKKKDD